jgi:hypothetical protein
MGRKDLDYRGQSNRPEIVGDALRSKDFLALNEGREVSRDTGGRQTIQWLNTEQELYEIDNLFVGLTYDGRGFGDGTRI